jgi:uncharacterized protein (TIGR02284 family)
MATAEVSTDDILDNLIEVCVDSEKRYRSAANDVGKAKLEQFFNQQADARKRSADELAVERKRLGGNGDESGTLGGLVDRAAMDFSVVMSMGDTGVVDWCREDEEKVIAEYEKALEHDLLPATRKKIEDQLAQSRATLASLEKVLKAYGGPRS